MVLCYALCVHNEHTTQNITGTCNRQPGNRLTASSPDDVHSHWSAHFNQASVFLFFSVCFWNNKKDISINYVYCFSLDINNSLTSEYLSALTWSAPGSSRSSSSKSSSSSSSVYILSAWKWVANKMKKTYYSFSLKDYKIGSSYYHLPDLQNVILGDARDHPFLTRVPAEVRDLRRMPAVNKKKLWRAILLICLRLLFANAWHIPNANSSVSTARTKNTFMKRWPTYLEHALSMAFERMQALLHIAQIPKCNCLVQTTSG